jgi:predicted CoA-binding protein
MNDKAEQMLRATAYAVVGASHRPHKYGHIAYRALKAAGKTVYAVNPRTEIVDSDQCYPSLASLPQIPDVAVMVVPPAVTEAAVAECARLGIRNIWMQPGAESAAAVAACREQGISVVSGGPCIMVSLRTAQFQTAHFQTTSATEYHG